MIYAYYRVSTDKQDYENQKEGVVAYCQRSGLKIDKEIKDEAVSGKVDVYKRNLGKLIKKAQKDDIIIVSEISRLGRDLIMVLNTAKTLYEKGVKIYCVKENINLDGSIMAKVFITVFGLIAEIERYFIAERTREALERKKANGVKLGRPKGSGNGTLKLEKQHDKIIYLMNKGNSNSKICKCLNVDIKTLRRYMIRSGMKKG